MRVVLVHGFTQSASSWEPVVASIRAAGGEDLEIVTWTLPGHGGASTLGAACDLPAAAAALGEACGKAMYVGYSMGGRLALQLALDRPELVSRLLLVSATAGIEDLEERAARRLSDEALARRIEAGGDAGLPAFLDEWLAGPLFSDLGDAGAGRAARLVNSASGLASALRALGTGAQLPSWERLGELAVPVLVLAGERDEKFVALGQRLASASGGHGRFVLVPGAGHAACFEQPESFSRLLVAFAHGQLPGVSGEVG